VTPDQARKIFDALPRSTLAVAVSDTTREDDLARILSLSPDAIQIYHSFRLPRNRSYRVFRVYSGSGVPSDCDAVVLDGSHGTGKRYDPETARRIAAESPVPVILSGGLTPETVSAAIAEIQPFAVDVSSGIESSTGCKDRERMKQFFSACREER
jgi:phosphoribosylanthranilate isomerase